MQINEKRMRKQGPKKVCGIERERSQNGQDFEKYQKKGVPKSIRIKGAEPNRPKNVWVPNWFRPGSNLGLAGGRGGQFFDSVLIQGVSS